jgi:endonuclease YncB( thermonuclease family)
MIWGIDLLIPALVLVALSALSAYSAVNPTAEGAAAAELIGCHDGDTCRFRLSPRGTPPASAVVESVRLLGIDAPELPGRCETERIAAEAARDFLLARLRAARRIEVAPVGRDAYGRLLARVRADGQDVSEALLAAGLARRYTGGRRHGWC